MRGWAVTHARWRRQAAACAAAASRRPHRARCPVQVGQLQQPLQQGRKARPGSAVSRLPAHWALSRRSRGRTHTPWQHATSWAVCRCCGWCSEQVTGGWRCFPVLCAAAPLSARWLLLGLAPAGVAGLVRRGQAGSGGGRAQGSPSLAGGRLCRAGRRRSGGGGGHASIRICACSSLGRCQVDGRRLCQRPPNCGPAVRRTPWSAQSAPGSTCRWVGCSCRRRQRVSRWARLGHLLSPRPAAGPGRQPVRQRGQRAADTAGAWAVTAQPAARPGEAAHQQPLQQPRGAARGSSTRTPAAGGVQWRSSATPWMWGGSSNTFRMRRHAAACLQRCRRLCMMSRRLHQLSAQAC